MTTSCTLDLPSPPRLVVGRTRVRDIDGFCGTLEYLGAVASAKNENEVYAGISWDDAQRGKHDGSVICRKTKKLVRHFSCEGGSFVRLSKLDVGIALDMAVIQSKYVTPNAPLVAPNNVLPHSARTSSGLAKPIEFHGELKLRDQQQVEMLSRIALRNMGISSVDASLTGLEHIIELDLGGNLFCDWGILPDILRAFSQLTTLSLASNRIGDIIEKPKVNSKLLSILNLHSCGIKSFATIQRLDELFPGLQELCVAGNDLSDLVDISAASGFQHLSRLDISNCNLTTWDEHLRKLSTLPSMETLLLNENKIRAFPCEIANGSFQKLKNLSLTGIELHDWSDIQGLACLPSISSLSLRNTPLTASMGTSEARFIVISRFPALEALNSSSISTKERIDAEKRYISQVTHELLLADVSESHKGAWLSKMHPQYIHLAKKFQGEINRQQQVAAEQNDHSYAVNITIKSMASGSCEMKALNRRLPSSLTIGRLKALCTRAFGLDLDLQVLFYRTEGDAFPTELNNNEYTLSFYGVSDGGEILMNELDLHSIEIEERKALEDHNQRVLEQEQEMSAMQDLQKSLRQTGRL